MTAWICPSCQCRIEAIAVEVGHACPARRRRWVAFRRVDESEASPVVTTAMTQTRRGPCLVCRRTAPLNRDDLCLRCWSRVFTYLPATERPDGDVQ
jgi:hypothetical protein